MAKKPSILLVASAQGIRHDHFIRKLNVSYDTHFLETHPLFKAGGTNKVVDEIQRSIREHNCEIVFFDVDFDRAVDASLIRESATAARLRVMVTFDDLVQHDFNRVTASACDFVLSSDPISVLKYLERDIPSCFLALEASKTLLFDRQLDRNYNLFHFGHITKADRQSFVDALVKADLHVDMTSREDGFLSYEDLTKLIGRSKIVLNFAKSGSPVDQSGAPYLLQFKGRVIEAGLCGTLCVSEYTPALELLFPDGEVPMFRTTQELVALIRKYQANENLRQEHALRLQLACAKFEDSEQMREITEKLAHAKRRENELLLPKSYQLASLLGRLSKYRTRHFGLVVSEVKSFRRRMHNVAPQSEIITVPKVGSVAFSWAVNVIKENFGKKLRRLRFSIESKF